MITTSETDTRDNLVQENQTLRTRIKELDTFAQTVAHDLKNPITTIRGFAGLIHNYPERLSQADIRETAGFILEESHRLERMIDAILLFSRVSDIEEITLEPLNMQVIVENVHSDLLKLISQSAAQIRVPEHWPVTFGYAPWVEHIWLNYLSNAIKYGGSPPVIELGAEPPANGQVMFWVRDNGQGLTPEQQTMLFEPFIRFKRHRAAGHGLGLAIVARIVAKLGGEVGVSSTPGQGSMFYFSLPAAPQ